MERKTVERI